MNNQNLINKKIGIVAATGRFKDGSDTDLIICSGVFNLIVNLPAGITAMLTLTQPNLETITLTFRNLTVDDTTFLQSIFGTYQQAVITGAGVEFEIICNGLKLNL